MRFSFAWVDAGTDWDATGLDREDEEIFALELAHNEGEFPTLSIDIRNPHVGLLAPSRKVWAWLGCDGGSTAGLQPLFLGRLVGVPQEVADDLVRLDFEARPADWDSQRANVAAALQVAPYWDTIWLTDDNRDNPDAVLEFYPRLWHIDRTSLAVTASDVTDGEDGTLDFGEAFFADSLDISYDQPPVRRIAVTGTVSWAQAAAGLVDFTNTILAAADAVGSRNGQTITTLTGQGLQADWPAEGASIGGGWTVGPSQAPRADGVVVPPDSVEQISDGLGAAFSIPVWALLPTFKCAYGVSRKRTETVNFTLEADCQALLTEPGDAETISLALGAAAVDAPVDPPTTAEPDGALPIGDVRRASYFKTDRGRQSLEALIAMARAALLMRARAVEVGFDVAFAAGLGLSCRQNARIADARLPGGAAAGKIIGYTLAVDGDTGAATATVRIGCMVGRGNSVTDAAGTPDYVEDGYVEAGYQTRTGLVVMPIAGEVTYDDFSGAALDDDGVDFFDMRPADLTDAATVFNGLTAQRADIASLFGVTQTPDASAIVSVLNAAFTQIDLDLKQVNGGPFATDFAITVSQLMVPKTIDLEAS